MKTKRYCEWRALSVGLYFATRRFESAVPMVLNTVPSSPADVTIQNLSGVLAQFFSSVDIGSPSVLTWTV